MGLFFRPQPRSHTFMTSDLETVIRQALADACAAGKHQFTQTKVAVRAVLMVPPDMTVSEASRAVEVVRRRS